MPRECPVGNILCECTLGNEVGKQRQSCKSFHLLFLTSVLWKSALSWTLHFVCQGTRMKEERLLLQRNFKESLMLNKIRSTMKAWKLKCFGKRQNRQGHPERNWQRNHKNTNKKAWKTPSEMHKRTYVPEGISTVRFLYALALSKAVFRVYPELTYYHWVLSIFISSCINWVGST